MDKERTEDRTRKDKDKDVKLIRMRTRACTKIMNAALNLVRRWLSAANVISVSRQRTRRPTNCYQNAPIAEHDDDHDYHRERHEVPDCVSDLGRAVLPESIAIADAVKHNACGEPGRHVVGNAADPRENYC